MNKDLEDWSRCINLVTVRKVTKSSLNEHHAMKAYWSGEGIAPHILDLGTRWR